jgi:hypothetical protein
VNKVHVDTRAASASSSFRLRSRGAASQGWGGPGTPAVSPEPKVPGGGARGRVFARRRHPPDLPAASGVSMWPPCGAPRALALIRPRVSSRACSGDGSVSYTQGQSPEPRTREYFYYVDHQGQVGWGRGRSPEGRARGEGSRSG